MVIDGGGSTCRARLVHRDGMVAGTATGGPSNVASAPDIARATIVQTLSAAYQDAGLDPSPRDAHFLALAGISATDDFLSKLKTEITASTVKLVSDLDAGVCAALGGNDGVVINVGTGSYFVAQKSGKQRRIGGRGYLISDECSGAWLGLKLLKAVVRAHDGLIDPTTLTQNVVSQCGGTIGDVSRFSMKATPQKFASFAPMIVKGLKNSDAVAKGIFDKALNRMCDNLDALGATSLGRIVLVGGLADTYQKLLPPKYKEICAAPYGDTLDGAVMLALQDVSGESA